MIRSSSERPILLRDVADVEERPQLKRGDASVNGHPAVVLTIGKQPTADTRQLTEEITKPSKACADLCPRTWNWSPSFISSVSSSIGAFTTCWKPCATGPSRPDHSVSVPDELSHHLYHPDRDSTFDCDYRACLLLVRRLDQRDDARGLAVAMGNWSTMRSWISRMSFAG